MNLNSVSILADLLRPLQSDKRVDDAVSPHGSSSVVWITTVLPEGKEWDEGLCDVFVAGDREGDSYGTAGSMERDAEEP